MKALAIAFLLVPSLALAQVPTKIGYMGRLLESTGAPVTGPKSFTFAIFDSASGGSQLWSENQTLVCTDGFYATHLGESSSIGLSVFAAGAERWLEVAVGGTAMAPRQKMGSVPYAYVSGNVNAGGLVFDQTGRIDKNRVDGCATAGEILVWSGSQWTCSGQKGVWTKIYDSTLTSVGSTTVSGLDGNRDRAYRIMFTGSIIASPVDRRFFIRPNGASTGFNGYYCGSGDWGGCEWETTAFCPGGNRWGTDGQWVADYTLHAETGQMRVGYGDFVFIQNDGAQVAWRDSGGRWTDTTTNITSLWIGTNGGTITGRLTVFAMR